MKEHSNSHQNENDTVQETVSTLECAKRYVLMRFMPTVPDPASELHVKACLYTWLVLVALC